MRTLAPLRSNTVQNSKGRSDANPSSKLQLQKFKRAHLAAKSAPLFWSLGTQFKDHPAPLLSIAWKSRGGFYLGRVFLTFSFFEPHLGNSHLQHNNTNDCKFCYLIILLVFGVGGKLWGRQVWQLLDKFNMG